MKINPAELRRESLLNSRIEVSENFSNETLAQLEDLQEDLAYLGETLAQTQSRFRKVLEENRTLKKLLLQMVEECWCTPGNRCAKCQRILLTLGPLNL
ncbi:hypothetical protein NG798_13845 [Ancylothrix sp. C2]|uniref:hypothetical protein n=1 Tax=Ancylothrix sp. D3o TaxID=2953691 RepID=UPI0021BB4F28|nr:hypothetical protein [Ancylothrix sp. D3o]MCT7950877.1 hypothetical protein [Ancylothrix sp. D3o]